MHLAGSVRLGAVYERISDATATEISGGGNAVERVADAIDTLGSTAGSGTSDNPQSGPVVDSAVLGRLSLNEATALHRELETLIANSQSSDSRVAPEDIRGGLDREVAAELSRDTTGAGEVIEGLASSDGTATRSEGERASQSAVGENEEQQERNAASGWRLSADDVHRTSVSGATGQIKVPGEIAGGIFSIDIGERNNVPCRISLNDYHGVNECGYALSADQELSVSIDSATIGGIAVCSNDRSNQRIKGIEIRGNVIREDGSMGAYRQDADEHTNCRRWEPVVLCPIDYAATGVVGHLNPRQRGSNELVGMQLICRRIVPE